MTEALENGEAGTSWRPGIGMVSTYDSLNPTLKLYPPNCALEVILLILVPETLEVEACTRMKQKPIITITHHFASERASYHL
jgi:hypothetical protein